MSSKNSDNEEYQEDNSFLIGHQQNSLNPPSDDTWKKIVGRTTGDDKGSKSNDE